MSDRGDYRSFYVSMLDDPDFRDMPGEDFKVFFALRLTLGAAGIGKLRRLVLCEQLKLTPAKLEKRLAALEVPKPDSELGWIVWDRRNDIVWIINALKYEPSLVAKNLNQRKYINGFLTPLSPHSKAVKSFWNQYPEWKLEENSDTPDPTRTLHIEGDTDTPPDGVGRGSEGGLKHKRQATSDKRLTTSDVLQATSDRPHSENGAPARSVRDRFLTAFYPQATSARRAQVERQLDAVLTAKGVQLTKRKDDVARARDEAHLNQALLDTISGPAIRNPDRAIVVAFRKLGNAETNAKGQTVTEAESSRNAEAIQLDERYNADAERACARWAREHPEEAEKIDRLVDSEFPETGSPFIEIARNSRRTQLRSKAAEFPSFEVWEEKQAVPA